MVNLEFGVTNGKYPDKKITIGEVAVINEYGTDTIPPRPAFRMGLEHAVSKNRKLMDATLKNITTHILTGRKASLERNLTQVLTQIGRSAKKETQNIIKQGTTEPNAPLTIARKGFDHPLWHTGQLYEHVSYKVSKE